MTPRLIATFAKIGEFLGWSALAGLLTALVGLDLTAFLPSMVVPAVAAMLAGLLAFAKGKADETNPKGE